MKTQVQNHMDETLQKMNTELGKLSDEDELPTWWTNKDKNSNNKLDGRQITLIYESRTTNGRRT